MVIEAVRILMMHRLPVAEGAAKLLLRHGDMHTLPIGDKVSFAMFGLVFPPARDGAIDSIPAIDFGRLGEECFFA